MTAVELKSYIYKVLKQVHPDTGMTSEVKESINNLLNLVLNKLVWVASDRVQLRGKRTLQPEDIAFAVNFLLPGNQLQSKYGSSLPGPLSLQRSAIKYHAEAISKWSARNSERKPGGPREDSAALAGLTFPPTRIENAVRAITPIDRVSKLTGVSLAAILEVIAGEIMEHAGNAARADKKVQIASDHLHTAISADINLAPLFEGVLLPGGYVKHQEVAESS